MSIMFQAQTIDDVPSLVEQSYRLRYQVYCLERHFLPADNYPDEMEHDAFDRHSVHVGVVDSLGALAGTARLIKNTDAGLPIFRYCVLFPDALRLDDSAVRLVEVSRLSISRWYRRRRTDGLFPAPPGREADPAGSVHERRDGGNDVFGTLIKAIYQAAKRLRATHWIVATEPSLQRHAMRYGLPFELAGPERDYLGLIAPYVMSLTAFDQVILARTTPLLKDFLDGLEPEFRPTLDDPSSMIIPDGTGSAPEPPNPSVP